MIFRILGLLEVEERGGPVELARGKERALLALLLLHRNEPVSTDRLIEELWGERPPGTPQKTVQVYVSRLRKALGGDRLRTTPAGYVLETSDSELDIAEFERLTAAAREALTEGDTARGERLLEEALDLWRGPPLADFSFDSWAQPEIRRLDELHAAARSDLAEARLALGRPERAIPELERLIHENPLWERPRTQLMLALYRAGRRAEALELYRKTRALLANELGIDPSPELVALERSILRQDENLAGPERETVTRLARRRGARYLAVGGALVLLAAVLSFVFVRGGRRVVSVSPDSIGVIDGKSNRLGAAVGVGVPPAAVAAGASGVWVATENDSLARLDPRTKEVRQTVRVGGGPTSVAVTPAAVWVANGLDGTLSRVDPVSNQVVQTTFVGNGPSGLAAGAGAIWVANSADGTVSRVDPASGRVTNTFAAELGASAITVGFQRLWVVSPETTYVAVLDPRSGQLLRRVSVGDDPDAVAGGAGAVWVANRGDGTVSKIDPQTSAVEDTIPVGHTPSSIAAGRGGVWVANAGDGTVTRIDPSRDRVIKTVRVDNPAEALTLAGRGVYVAVRSTGREHRGGRLRVAVVRVPHSIDPAFADPSAWPALVSTNDGLVGFRRVGGVQGTELVPDLAAALPTVSEGGRRYTFQLRRGIRYSNGRLVQPDDFRRAIERVLLAKAPPDAKGYYTGIVGAERCVERSSCDLSRGILINRSAHTITFRLVEPDGDFLLKLALPQAFAVPLGTPVRDVGTQGVPATGPYRIAEFRSTPFRLRLVRNSRFRQWSADAQPDGYPDTITWSSPRNLSASVRAVERGSADIAGFLALLPKRELEQVATRHSAQLRLSTRAETNFFFLNTRTPPFDDVRVRRAVNDAFDREEFARRVGPGVTPTCRIIAPTLPGYRPSCPYATGGIAAVDAARRAVARSGTRGTKVAVWVPSPEADWGRYMVDVLDEIGYRARLRAVPVSQANGPAAYFSKVVDSRVRAQTGYWGWSALPAVADVIQPLFGCAAFVPRSPMSNDPAEFCDRSIDGQMKRAAALQAQDPPAATLLWQRIEREILDQAPMVPTSNRRNIDFLSKRVGNYEYNPQWSVLYDQLWVK